MENLPPHDKISLGFVLAIIDSWDGEFFTVTVDGESVFSHSFSNRPGLIIKVMRLLKTHFWQGLRI